MDSAKGGKIKGEQAQKKEREDSLDSNFFGIVYAASVGRDLI